MRRLYQDETGERLTLEGKELVKKIEDFLRPIYSQASKDNISLRDVKIAVDDASSMVMLDTLLDLPKETTANPRNEIRSCPACGRKVLNQAGWEWWRLQCPVCKEPMGVQ